MGRLLKGGQVVDPVAGSVAHLDVLLEGNIVVAMGADLAHTNHEVIEVAGLYVLPGLIDPHVHLREPGQTHKETIATGAMAAAAGGFTQICCMPNTAPVTDDEQTVRFIRAEAERCGYATVHPIAAITTGLRGTELTDFSALRRAGAVGFSDDGKGVQSAAVMRQALRAAKALSAPIVVHAEDETLSAGGHVHAGEVAQRLGLNGIPSSAETVMIARDIILAEETGAHVHMCHVSPEEAVAAIRAGRRRGVRVTSEVTPHHLLLTEAALETWGALAKVNPPLRAERDRQACIRGLLDGTLSMIATDHAPHTEQEKARGIADAPFGFVGLETSFALLFTAFVASGVVSLPQLVRWMSTEPARVFGLQGGQIRVGERADITVIDPRQTKVVNPAEFRSKGRNTPFAGRVLAGWPTLTIHAGRTVFAN